MAAALEHGRGQIFREARQLGRHGRRDSQRHSRTLERSPAAELGLNDLARVRLRLGSPLAADPYAANRSTGAFILIDEGTNDTVAAGMVEA